MTLAAKCSTRSRNSGIATMVRCASSASKQEYSSVKRETTCEEMKAVSIIRFIWKMSRNLITSLPNPGSSESSSRHAVRDV